MNCTQCTAGLGCKRQVIIPICKTAFDVSSYLRALAELGSRLKRLSSRHYSGCIDPEGSHGPK
jgi:hypothetical protein